ncbi:MAG: helix-turn-helix domain-containing protein, partial [Bacteroidales bacterium]|nr:helix-turn-helix domain-containing protein [Bacteroidales bacterium]
YFKSFRLNKAMEMIVEGKTKLAVIADLTGFSTSGHFASSFKKQFGKLPSDINKTKTN